MANLQVSIDSGAAVDSFNLAIFYSSVYHGTYGSAFKGKCQPPAGFRRLVDPSARYTAARMTLEDVGI